jgi:hypothetical protein
MRMPEKTKLVIPMHKFILRISVCLRLPYALIVDGEGNRLFDVNDFLL